MSIRKHILVPIDFSSLSNDALRATRDLAFDYTDITLLYAYDPFRLKSPATLVLEPKKFGLPQCIALELLERLRRIRKAELKDFKNVNLEIVVNPDPAKAICQHAARQRVDLVILATHGRRGVSRLLSGSVTENLVRGAPCAVLAINPRPYLVEEPSLERLPLVSPATA
jgi:nucleotide-binding universal stress UspA family protein